MGKWRGVALGPWATVPPSSSPTVSSQYTGLLCTRMGVGARCNAVGSRPGTHHLHMFPASTTLTPPQNCPSQVCIPRTHSLHRFTGISVFPGNIIQSFIRVTGQAQTSVPRTQPKFPPCMELQSYREARQAVGKQNHNTPHGNRHEGNKAEWREPEADVLIRESGRTALGGTV